MIHPAAKFEFERAVREYARWLAVEQEARSPAAAWWWSSALGVGNAGEPLPAEWAETLALPAGARYADGARVMLTALAEQTALPWPDDFPRRYQAKPAELPGS